MNESVTEVIVEQPRLHQVCYISCKSCKAYNYQVYIISNLLKGKKEEIPLGELVINAVLAQFNI